MVQVLDLKEDEQRKAERKAAKKERKKEKKERKRLKPLCVGVRALCT